MNLSANLYQMIFEQSHAAIILLDQKVILDCTLKTGELFQQPKEDLVDQPWSILFPVKQADGLESIRQFETILENSVRGQAQDFTWLCQRKDKKSFQTQIKLQQIILADQILFQVVIQEAFVHEQMEQALAETEFLYKAGRRINTANTYQDIIMALAEAKSTSFFNQIILMSFEYDETGELEALVTVAMWQQNENMAASSRYLRKEFTSIDRLLSLEPIIIEDVETTSFLDANLKRRLLDLNMRSSVVLPLWGGGRQWGVLTLGSTEPHQIIDQQIQPYISLAAQIAVTIDNLRLFDQVQQRVVELEETSNFLNSVIDNIPSGLLVKEARSLKFVHWNRANEKLTGIAKDLVLGKTEYDFLPKAIADSFADSDRSVLTKGKLVDISEELLPTLDRGLRLLHTRKVPILGNDGQPKYLLAIFDDITERKRTEEILLKRATELETVVEVSTQIASVLDPDELLHAMVDLTKSRFGLYHVHVYLLNTDRQNKMLVLTAGSGEIGREMLKKGWQIPLGQQQSIVSRAARTRTGVLVNRVREETDWLPNALLPDTASELAVPMIAGGSLLGVLDIQSEIVDYFVEEDIKIQTILATQVAIALQNAHLYAQTQGQAEQEYLVNTITQKIQNTMTIEGALQTAIQELGQALQAPYTYVELERQR